MNNRKIKESVIMKQSTKIKVLVFLVIALMAFTLAGFLSATTHFDNTNSQKMVSVENDNFEPHSIDQVEIKTPKIENTTYNATNNTNNTNNSITTTVEEWTDDVVEIANTTFNDLL